MGLLILLLGCDGGGVSGFSGDSDSGSSQFANEMKQKYRMRKLGRGEVIAYSTHLRGRIARLDHLLILLLLLLLLKLLLLRLLLRCRRNL